MHQSNRPQPETPSTWNAGLGYAAVGTGATQNVHPRDKTWALGRNGIPMVILQQYKRFALRKEREARQMNTYTTSGPVDDAVCDGLALFSGAYARPRATRYISALHAYTHAHTCTYMHINARIACKRNAGSREHTHVYVYTCTRSDASKQPSSA